MVRGTQPLAAVDQHRDGIRLAALCHLVGAHAVHAARQHHQDLADHNTATNQGILEGTAAADRAAALGFGWLAPVYFDMEAYPSGGACTDAVLAFTIGWTYVLHQRGYLAGYYSSLCSGILDVANSISIMPREYLFYVVWISVAWNDVPNIFGFNQPGRALWDVWWSNHGRESTSSGAATTRLWGGAGDHRWTATRSTARPGPPDASVTASPGSRRAECPPRGREGEARVGGVAVAVEAIAPEMPSVSVACTPRTTCLRIPAGNCLLPRERIAQRRDHDVRRVVGVGPVVGRRGREAGGLVRGAETPRLREA